MEPEKQVGNRTKSDCQWKPGQSGNPGGRPKGAISLTALLRQVLSQQMPGDDRTYGDAVVRRIVAEAIKGNTKAQAMILDRIEGKAIQTVSVVTTDPESIAGMTDDAIWALLHSRQQGESPSE